VGTGWHIRVLASANHGGAATTSKSNVCLLATSALAQDLLLEEIVVSSDRKSGTFHRVDWFRHWRTAASEVARQLEAERWSWARSWGLRKATEAIKYFGCDLRRGAPRRGVAGAKAAEQPR
jgi:hypothetical protein